MKLCTMFPNIEGYCQPKFYTKIFKNEKVMNKIQKERFFTYPLTQKYKFSVNRENKLFTLANISPDRT